MNNQFTIKGLPNDLLTNEIVNERKLKTDGTPKDYFIEVAKGNVPGDSLSGIVMRSTAVTNTGFVDLWGGSANLIPATANETWEVRSNSADDALGGIGANSFTQNYLDENHVKKSITVDLDGVNWVTLNPDMFTANGAVAIPSGSNKTNVGLITVRDSSTLNPRQFIKPEFSASQDGYYTVSAGKKVIALQTVNLFPKNQDGVLRSKVMLPGTNTWIKGIELPLYQNAVAIEIKALLPFQEGTTVVFEVKSTNAGPVTVSSIFEILETDT
jgi:hypothetical protein